MKKLLSAAVGLVLAFTTAGAVQAKTVQVSALEDFNTANPPQVLHVQMNANTRLDYDVMLFQGYQVAGRIAQANGGFTFTPIAFVNFQEEQVPIKKEFAATYKGGNGIIRQNQPFLLVFPENGPDTFQYYVPSSSDINK